MFNKLQIMNKKKIYFVVSAVLVLVSIASWAIQGLELDVDFTGGTTFYINIGKDYDTNEVADIVKQAIDLEPSSVQRSGANGHEVVIKTRALESEQRSKLFEAVAEKYDLSQDDLLTVDNVSPTVGKELQQGALISTSVAVVLMLVYITIRFEFFSGVAAIITLIQNVLLTIGLFSLFRLPVNTTFIAAILTILGYSINDTIVIFDRIRENTKLHGNKMSNDELVDTSVRQSVLRSVNTTLTTLIPIALLLIFGVRSLSEFTIPLVFGISVGAMSSIFMASPIWATLKTYFANLNREPAKKSR